MKLNANILLFILVVASYAIYPVWNVPAPLFLKFIFFNCFLLIATALYKSKLNTIVFTPNINALKEYFIPLGVTAIACLPFWLMPLITGGDDQSHAGPAAYFLGKIIERSSIPPFIISIAIISLIILSILVFKKNQRFFSRLSDNKIIFSTIIGLNIYFVFLIKLNIVNKIGKWETILRYPPLSKFIYLTFYAIFGIHELIPRMIQFLFVSAAIVFLIKTAKLIIPKVNKTFTYLLLIFFPSFFYLTISAEIEGATIFFFASSTYYFIKSITQNNETNFLKSMFFMSIGFINKRLLLFLLIAYIPVLLYFIIIKKDQRNFYISLTKHLWIPIVTGLPFILLGSFYKIRVSGITIENITNFQAMFEIFKNFYQTSGPYISIIIVAGCLYSIITYRKRTETWLILYLGMAYYFMISMYSAIGCIRLAQPFYLCPIFFFLLAANISFEKINSKQIKALIATLLIGLFAYYSIFDKHPYQRKTIHNYHHNTFPYWQVAQYLKSLKKLPIKIYAPMKVEPSHFYLAKYKIINKTKWNRKMPINFSDTKLLEEIKSRQYDYILLPYIKVHGIDINFEEAANKLLKTKDIKKEKIFVYKKNRLILLKIEKAS